MLFRFLCNLDNKNNEFIHTPTKSCDYLSLLVLLDTNSDASTVSSLKVSLYDIKYI